jgi:hypothetical protein
VLVHRLRHATTSCYATNICSKDIAGSYRSGRGIGPERDETLALTNKEAGFADRSLDNHLDASDHGA